MKRGKTKGASMTHGNLQYACFQFGSSSDTNGNAELVWTGTGIWVVSCDAKNRPASFRDVSTGTLVECAYDYRGRRCTKKVTVAGTVTLHERYIYRDYLQIACVDLTRAAHPALWFVLWDPTQETATRPLALQKDGSWFTYGHDLTKNVWEVFGPSGYIRTSYDYAPFGAVTATGDVSQPFQWSSEFYDSELGLVYYNYRHYSPSDGRWLSRDPIEEQGGVNLYAYCSNIPNFRIDQLGNDCNCHEEGRFGECLTNCMFGAETAWAYTALGISFPAMSVPLKPFAPLGSTPTWTTLLSFIELKTGIKIGLRMLGRRLNPVSNLIALSALSFLLGRLIGCLGVCAIDDSTY